MKPFPPLVYFGSDNFSAEMLSALLTHDDFKSSLKYVVTKTPRILGRGQKTHPTDVEKVAKAHSDATIVYANNRRELDAALAKLELEKDTPLGVLVSYGVILSDQVLSLFPHGIINFHPSRLPLYRGPSPVESALLNGDSTIGLSIMKLTAEMDAGPVFEQITLSLTGNETRQQVYDRIVEEGAHIFYTSLKEIAAGTLQPTEQEHSEATYTRLIKKEDGILRPDTKTAAELEREIRTFLGFPKSRIEILDRQVIVTKAHIAQQANDGDIVIACKDDTFLSIDEVIAPSGRTMPAAAFMRGYAAS